MKEYTEEQENRMNIIGQNGNDGKHYDKTLKDDNYYIEKEVEYSTKCVSLLEILDFYALALFENRREYVGFSKGKALETAPENYDKKRFNTVIKNKLNRINNEKQGHIKYYKKYIDSYNLNTKQDEVLKDILIRKFDNFYDDMININGTKIEVKD